MRILHTVENYWPATGGMAEAVRQVSERLTDRGHDVTVATGHHQQRGTALHNGVKIAEFRVSGNWAKGMSGNVDSYRQFVRGGGFDLVVNFAAQQWSTDALLDCLDEISATKILVPTGFSGLPWQEYRDYYKRMPDWLQQYDRLVFLGRECRDARFAEQHKLNHTSFIPNGASAEEFLADTQTLNIREQLGITRGHTLVLLVGSHTGLKGHAEAIRIFARSELRQATLLIVGSEISQPCGLECRRQQRRFRIDPRQFLSGRQLRLEELTRPQTVAVFREADIFLFPSMIECSPIVLFECLASKTPFLATAVGNVNEMIEWTSAGEILPGRINDDGLCHVDIDSGARLLTQLSQDKERRMAMAESGFAAWNENFTWEHVANKYERLYEELRG